MSLPLKFFFEPGEAGVEKISGRLPAFLPFALKQGHENSFSERNFWKYRIS